MGMCLVMCTLSDSNIDKVLADPPLIWKVVAPDDPEAYSNARQGSGGLLTRFLGWKRPNRAVDASLDLSPGEGESIDLDKAWHGIHYLLNGSASEGEPPLNLLVGGGMQVGDLEVGYGPARAFTSQEVRAISHALGPIHEDMLRIRFDPGEMMRIKIYPEIWDRDPEEDDTFGYCAEYFAAMKAGVADAAAGSLGLVVYLS